MLIRDNIKLAKRVIRFLSCHQGLKDRRLNGFVSLFSLDLQRFYNRSSLMTAAASGAAPFYVSDASCSLNCQDIRKLQEHGTVMLAGEGERLPSSCLKRLLRKGHVWIQYSAQDIVRDSLLSFALRKHSCPKQSLSLTALSGWGALVWNSVITGDIPQVQAPGWGLVASEFADFLNRVAHLSESRSYHFQRLRYIHDGNVCGMIFESGGDQKDQDFQAFVVSEMIQKRSGPMILNIRSQSFELGYFFQYPGGLSRDAISPHKQGLVFIG